MNKTTLKTRHLLSLFATQNSNLTELCMCNQNLSSVPSQSLSWTICRLKTVDIYDTKLTGLQVRELFAEMSKGTNLDSLNISSCNLSTVPPTILATCVNNLKEVNMMCTKLTIDQVQAIFQVMSAKTRLEQLNVHGNHLTEVSTATLASAIDNLRSADMSETD